MAGISDRKIAGKLGSSTAPVYTSFSSVEEIKHEVLNKSLQLLLSYMEKDYTKDIFLNMGVGMLEFAKEFKQVYRTLFIESNANKHILKEFTANLELPVLK